jgi:hypothetical protein
MFAFLEHQFSLRKSDELAGLLGSLSLLPDGSPADPALASDWSAAVRRAVEGRVNVAMKLKGGQLR